MVGMKPREKKVTKMGKQRNRTTSGVRGFDVKKTRSCSEEARQELKKELRHNKIEKSGQLLQLFKKFTRISQGINYEKAAAEAFNNVTQDLTPKKIEQRLKQDLEQDTLDCKTKTGDERQSNSQEQLKHLENGDWETLRYYEDWGEDHEYTSIYASMFDRVVHSDSSLLYVRQP